MGENKKKILILSWLLIIISFILGFYILQFLKWWNKQNINNFEKNKKDMNITSINNDSSFLRRGTNLKQNKKRMETDEEIIYNDLCKFQRILRKIKNKDDYFNQFDKYVNNNKKLLNYLKRNKKKVLDNLLNTYYCISYRRQDLKYMKNIFLFYITNAYKCNKVNDWTNIFNNYLTDISCIDKTFKTNNFLRKEEIEYKTEKWNIVKETIYKFNFNIK